MQMQISLMLEIRYQVAEHSLELSIEPRMTLNSRSFCAVIAGLHLHGALSSAAESALGFSLTRHVFCPRDPFLVLAWTL